MYTKINYERCFVTSNEGKGFFFWFENDLYKHQNQNYQNKNQNVYD